MTDASSAPDDLAEKVERVVRAALQEHNPPGDEEIMFRFKTLDQFRAFVRKLLLVGRAP